ncbi:serine protease [Ideonella sp. A 288]|uniref:S1 family peptidase n=1 Tax=Ideonella sp. A 288 TaxID=1962181 RepID=UPI0013030188|nr:serine protease [Ideonella sp. A 288]
MKRLLSLVLGAAAASVVAAEIDRSAMLALSASVLKIEAVRHQGGYSLGSGVVVAPETVVTNCHVTGGTSKIHVLRGGVRWEAAARLSDFDHDLCVLDVPGLRAAAVTLGRSDLLKPGQPVTALGYTGGMSLQNSAGEVVAVHRFDGSGVIRSSNWFTSGASGGGLFDADLRLVGILTFRLRGGQAHYFAAPIEWLSALLQGDSETARRGAPGHAAPPLAYWQRPAVDQPRFLRAALLQRDDRWPELASLASDWVRLDASDAEPWYLLGLAMTRMNRWPEARAALECSLSIDPDSSATQAELAVVETHHIRSEPAPLPGAVPLASLAPQGLATPAVADAGATCATDAATLPPT